MLYIKQMLFRDLIEFKFDLISVTSSSDYTSPIFIEV